MLQMKHFYGGQPQGHLSDHAAVSDSFAPPSLCSQPTLPEEFAAHAEATAQLWGRWKVTAPRCRSKIQAEAKGVLSFPSLQTPGSSLEGSAAAQGTCLGLASVVLDGPCLSLCR